jgi:hypothetical protein
MEQILFISLHIIIRTFIIAVRYGSCSELRFSLLKDQTQTLDFLGKDLIGVGWLNFDPIKGLFSELNSCLWRNQVEESLFEFQFIEKLDIEYTNRLKDETYYGLPPEDEKSLTQQKRIYNVYNHKTRRQEIMEFQHRAKVIQMLEDLGQRNVAMCDTELLYTLTLP